MTATAPRWFVVMLPGESADLSELYGPFRSEVLANEARDRWNATNGAAGDQAEVLPISAASNLKEAL